MCIRDSAWAVSLGVRAVRAAALKRPFVMLNGVLSNTRVMTVEGVELERDRRTVMDVAEDVYKRQEQRKEQRVAQRAQFGPEQRRGDLPCAKPQHGGHEGAHRRNPLARGLRLAQSGHGRHLRRAASAPRAANQEHARNRSPHRRHEQQPRVGNHLVDRLVVGRAEHNREQRGERGGLDRSADCRTEHRHHGQLRKHHRGHPARAHVRQLPERIASPLRRYRQAGHRGEHRHRCV